MGDAPLRRVARSEELPAPAASASDESAPGSPAPAVRPEVCEVDVDGQPVLVTRLASGEVVAFAAHCPHQGTPLRSAALLADDHIRCEQHRFVYDTRTGRNIMPTREASPEALMRLKPAYLPTYEVVERDGWVWLAAEPNPPPDDDSPPPAPAPGLVGGAGRPEPAGAEADGLVEDRHRPAQTVEAVVGDELELDLPTQPRPAHLWQVEVDNGVVDVVGQHFEHGDDALHYRVRVVAQAAGTAKVRCTYARPWGRASDTRAFIVRVGAA